MRHAGPGFTLIEVVVAVTIVGLLLSGVYGVFGSVSAARERFEREGILYHQARIFFDRIGGELSSMRFSPIGSQPPLVAGSTEFGTPYLEFNTELASPLQKKGGGLTRVRYELREVDESATLFRSEQMILVDLAPLEALPFVTDLSSFTLRYYDDGQWHDSWSAGHPPRMIEILFDIEISGDAPTPFRSSFVLTGGSG
ncbi:MAG: type II secretion system protein GspJ [Pelovirga sp.]